MTPIIADLDVQHLVSVQSLLLDNSLPFEDIAEHIDHFVGVFDRRKIIGIGGLEFLNKKGMLRSVVVREGFRGRGLAGLIVEHLHEKARMNELQKLYLFTETAQGYFEKFGYQSVLRADLPEEIKSTQQFLFLCPASAQAMHFNLAN